jgi:hypothetical protein
VAEIDAGSISLTTVGSVIAHGFLLQKKALATSMLVSDDWFVCRAAADFAVSERQRRDADSGGAEVPSKDSFCR